MAKDDKKKELAYSITMEDCEEGIETPKGDTLLSKIEELMAKESATSIVIKDRTFIVVTANSKKKYQFDEDTNSPLYSDIQTLVEGFLISSAEFDYEIRQG